MTMRELKDDDELMTIKEFINDCKMGGLIDYDGFGEYATKDKCSDIMVTPSDVINGKIKTGWTHVVWYNR